MFNVARRALSAAFLVLLLQAATAGAQIADHPLVHVRSQGISSADLDRFGLNTWDRIVLGARSRAMGGTYLAMPGDPSNGPANPAAVSWISAPQLASESRYRLGSASGVFAPHTIPAPGFGALPVSNYRPGQGSSYTYNDITFFMPLALIGRPAGLALSYRRMIDFKGSEETRFMVETPQGDADFGQGSEFSGGVDALTPAIAWNLNDRISFGAALNFLNGTIRETGNQGVSSFGFVVVRGGLLFEQDVYGTSLDLGTRMRVTDDISVGGVVQTGHSLKFRNGFDSVQPLPDPNLGPDEPFYVLERDLMDHNLSVPTKYGVGVAWSLLNKRVTLAADYWNRGWSRAEITRKDFRLEGVFRDSTSLVPDSVNVIPLENDVTKNAGLSNTHHIRLGAEWLITGGDNGGIQIPLRVGFRREPYTFTNVDTVSYNEAYRRLEAALVSSETPQERQAAYMRELENIYKNASTLLSGSEVPATTLSAGTGVTVGTFSIDLAVSRTSYSVERVFLGAFSDVTRNPKVDVAKEKRSHTEFTFTTTLRF